MRESPSPRRGGGRGRATGVSPARAAALAVLDRVRRGGQFANDALDLELRRAPLSSLDRALATELAYGVLRRRGTIDYYLDQVAVRPTGRIDPPLLDVLRLGAYQILFLDRIPEHAAVSEAVSAARRLGEGQASFTNAVLRGLLRRRSELRLPSREADPVGYLAVAGSHPAWLVERWVSRYGLEEAEALCLLNNGPAPLCLRANTLRATAEQVREKLEAAGIRVRPGSLAPEALVVEGKREKAEVRGAGGEGGEEESGARREGSAGGVESWPGFAEGLFYVQDESSMMVARALGPAPGMKVIDACAAPGGKTTHLAQLMGDRGTIVANDVSEPKLALIKENLTRLGVGSVQTALGDASELSGRFAGWADAVLVDAPCSALGVAGRRPDVRWRVKPGDLAGLAAEQARIAGAASSCVRPGGVMVYSVCSLEPEEGPEVVRAFLDGHPDFRPESLAPWVGDALGGEPGVNEGRLHLMPQRHGSDGFFLARLRRSEWE